jgi:hypothetical protein
MFIIKTKIISIINFKNCWYKHRLDLERRN